MKLFEFICFINVEAEDYDSAIAMFDSNIRYGMINKNDVYHKFIFLDDIICPSNIKFGSNTYLYCDPKNWGTSGFYGQTRRRLEWYCSNKEKYGSQVVCFNQGGTHMNFQILKSFYNKFGNRL